MEKATQEDIYLFIAVNRTTILNSIIQNILGLGIPPQILSTHPLLYLAGFYGIGS